MSSHSKQLDLEVPTPYMYGTVLVFSTSHAAQYSQNSGVMITVVDGLLVTMSETLVLGTARGVKRFVGPAVR